MYVIIRRGEFTICTAAWILWELPFHKLCNQLPAVFFFFFFVCVSVWNGSDGSEVGESLDPEAFFFFFFFFFAGFELNHTIIMAKEIQFSIAI